MYKCLNRFSGLEIIILDPQWRQQVSQLRILDKQNILICPGCQQPVRIRTGLTKRWHFAHKHLQNCPFENESPALLKSRAVLYDWLVVKFGHESVEIEKKVADPHFPRPVDCWVKTKMSPIAYWIFDRRMPPAEREGLILAFIQLNAQVNFIFTSEMLRQDESDPSHIFTTTTEREFMVETDFDQSYQGDFPTPGKTLHYLSPELEMLVTLRGLLLLHSPQLYAGHRLNHQLSEVKVALQTGDFVHPGEQEILQQALQEKQAMKRRRQRANEAFITRVREDENLITKARSGAKELPTCIFCGKKTKEYWYLNQANNTYKCKDCYQNGRY